MTAVMAGHWQMSSTSRAHNVRGLACVTSFKCDAYHVAPVDPKTYWVAEKDGTVSFRSAVNGKQFGVLPLQYDAHVLCILPLAPRSTAVWLGMTDGTILVTDSKGDTTERIHVVRHHGGAVVCMLHHKDWVFSGSSDTKIGQFHAESRTFMRHFMHHVNGVRCLVASGNQLYSAGDDSITVWDVQSGECFGEFFGHKAPVLALTTVGNMLWSASEDNTIRIWNMEESNLVKVLERNHVVTSLMGVQSVVWAGDLGGELSLYNSQTGEVLQMVSSRSTGDSRVLHACAATVQRVWTCGADGQVRVWHHEDNTVVPVSEENPEMEYLKSALLERTTELSRVTALREKQMEASSREAMDLRKALNAAEAQIAVLQHRCDEASGQSAGVSKQREESDKVVNDLRQKLATRNAQLQEKEAEIAALEQRIKENTTEFEAYQKRADEERILLETRLHEHCQKSEELSRECTNQGGELRKLRQHVNHWALVGVDDSERELRLMREVAELQKTLRMKEDQIFELKSHTAEAQGHVELGKREKKTLEREMEQKDGLLQEIVREKETSLDTIALMEGAMRQGLELLRQKESTQRKLTSSSNEYAETIKLQNNLISEKNITIGILKENVKRTETDFDRQLKERDKEIDALKATLTRLTSNIEDTDPRVSVTSVGNGVAPSSIKKSRTTSSIARKSPPVVGVSRYVSGTASPRTAGKDGTDIDFVPYTTGRAPTMRSRSNGREAYRSRSPVEFAPRPTAYPQPVHRIHSAVPPTRGLAGSPSSPLAHAPHPHTVLHTNNDVDDTYLDPLWRYRADVD